MTSLAGPRPLAPSDDVTGFDSGEPVVDEWLIRQAWAADRAQTARTYVVVDDPGRVVAYFCLSAFAMHRADVGGGWLARNAPDPVPAILLGRLGIDTRYQGRHLGAALLKEAVLKGLAAARLIGARALLVHAASESAAGFYERFGFRRMPSDASTLFLPWERLL